MNTLVNVMKKYVRILSLLIALSVLVCSFAACAEKETPESTTQSTQSTESVELVDYASQTLLDRNSGTLQQEVTVRNFIDGDTTHFNVPTSIRANGILKARYLCVNTPESTGMIEEWGKKASDFTKEKLKNAVSIIIESNDSKWNADSTGDRFLVWVWYQPSANEAYRCLNLELVQEGLSISCGTVDERYGSVASQAFQQAKANKLHVFSGEEDPDFYYGDAYEIDLKTLRTCTSLYQNAQVAFEGTIVRNSNNSVYVESYDAETDMYYGMSVYYGFQTGELLNNIKVGNKARIVGTVTYYETGGTWQVSGLQYSAFDPKDPANTIKISEGNEPGNRLTDAATFTSQGIELEVQEAAGGEFTGTKAFSYAELAMSTSIRMENLTVESAYTTNNGGDSDGAMTLTCSVDGIPITVRTMVLRHEDGSMVTEGELIGKTIDVTGIVDSFSGEYQIKVFKLEDINIHQ